MLKITDGNKLSPKNQLIHKIISTIAVLVSLFVLFLLYYDSYIGLQIVWNLLIPIAPLIFLLVPNLWTSMCPLAIFQSLPKRFNLNKDRYLNKKQTLRLNYVGLILFFILVPARFFIFNIEGEISLLILVLLVITALVFGFIYTGLSGWCMGLCPIRPVELMYGQFTIEKNRPEACNTCDQCVSNCSRLHLQDEEETFKYNNPFRFFMYAFPGFIFMYFNINPEDLFYMIYLKIYAASMISLFILYFIDKMFLNYRESMILSALISISLYYFFSIPAVAESWFVPQDIIPFLYLIPLISVIFALQKYTNLLKKAKFLISTAIVLFLCFTSSAFIWVRMEVPNYLNWEEHAVFVGNEACGTCHSDIVEDFSHSEMGTSFLPMDDSHEDLDIKTSYVYDKKQDLNYIINKRNDLYYMDEYRINELTKDTIHKLSIKIDFVIGSGANTKSFIFERNGYFFEMPITWYPHKNKWDLSPGYQKYNQRFFRKTNQKCIDCHNATTDFEDLSEHRFQDVGNGIDCEKCHGPASLHIEYRQGKEDFLFDPILNPEDQDQDYMVCYDCHSKKEFSIHEVDYKINFTAHATRLSLSKCFTEGDITCITCHDPHNKLEKTVNDFNRACISCHGEENIKLIPDHEELEDCTTCHMPSSGSRDIPHVSATEHWIRVQDKNSDKYREAIDNSYLDYIIPSSISEWEKRKATEFLKYYQNYIGSSSPKIDTLILAENYLDNQSILRPKEKYTLAKIKYYRQKYLEASRIFKGLEETDIEYFEKDAEFYYFYGKSLIKYNKKAEGEITLKKSLNFYPNYIPTLLELSLYYFDNKRLDQSLYYCNSILNLNPYERDALYHLAFIFQAKGETKKAMEQYNNLLKFYPDDHDGNINLTALEFQNDKDNYSMDRLLQIYRHYPESSILLANIVRLYAIDSDKENAVKYLIALKKITTNPKYIVPLQRMIDTI